MNGCHNCEHAAAIAAGEYADRDWAKVPCSTCDVMRGADQPFEVMEGLSDDVEMPFAEVETDDLAEMMPVTVLLDFVTGFLKLKPELRDVVAWRYCGMQYEDIASLQGVTFGCVEKRLRRAITLWPELKSLFPRKISNQYPPSNAVKEAMADE